MVTRCNVIKEFGQYELLNVCEDTREQISRIFKQHNHDVKVTGNICMEAFSRRICEHYKDGEYRVHYSILGIQKHVNGRKSPVWKINGFESIDD